MGLGDWLKYIIPAAAGVGGSLIGARATGKASDTAAESSEYAADLAYKSSQDNLKNLREIYNMDMGLNWGGHRLSQESLGRLAFGSGSDLPMSAFETPEDAPQLPMFGGAGGGGAGPGGDLGAGSPTGDGTLDGGPGTPAPGLVRPNPVGTGVSRTLAGAGLGGALGGPIGAGVGAVGGLVSSLFGRGRREADQIVPYQEQFGEWFIGIANEVDSRSANGTLTPEFLEWVIKTSGSERDAFYSFVEPFGRAGPGAKKTVGGYLDPILGDWQKLLDDPNTQWGTAPEPAPKPMMYGGMVKRRAGGGGVNSFSGMSQPYMVGEAGPEMYVPEQGQPQMVGAAGPEVRSFPQDGQIIPNHDLNMRPTIQMSKMADGIYGVPGRAEGGPVEGSDPPDQAIIKEWGWRDNGDGTWAHPETGLTGRWTDGDTFRSDDGGATYDRLTGKVTTDGGSDITDPTTSTSGGYYKNPSDPPDQAIIKEWGWRDNGDGTWAHPETGLTGRWTNSDTFRSDDGSATYDRRTGKVTTDGGSDITDPTTSGSREYYRNLPAPPITKGEFLRPNPTHFSPPPSNVAPFSFDEGAEGYRPFNEEFGFDAERAGYMPLNEQFSFDEAAEGYRPFNEEFSFNADDLLEDPGYQWRMDEGNKGVERRASSRGLLESGKTLKDFGRWSQGLASQEFGKAYGRASQEYDREYGQGIDAYNRSRDRWGTRYGQSLAAYGRASGEYDREYSQGVDARNRGLQEWGMEYGQDTDDYTRAWDQFLNKQGQWQRDRDNRFGTLLTLSQV